MVFLLEQLLLVAVALGAICHLFSLFDRLTIYGAFSNKSFQQWKMSLGDLYSLVSVKTVLLFTFASLSITFVSLALAHEIEELSLVSEYDQMGFKFTYKLAQQMTYQLRDAVSGSSFIAHAIMYGMGGIMHVCAALSLRYTLRKLRLSSKIQKFKWILEQLMLSTALVLISVFLTPVLIKLCAGETLRSVFSAVRVQQDSGLPLTLLLSASTAYISSFFLIVISLGMTLGANYADNEIQIKIRYQERRKAIYYMTLLSFVIIIMGLLMSPIIPINELIGQLVITSSFDASVTAVLVICFLINIIGRLVPFYDKELSRDYIWFKVNLSIIICGFGIALLSNMNYVLIFKYLFNSN